LIPKSQGDNTSAGKNNVRILLMENIYKLPLVLDPQPEGGWTITCPDLPGLVTEADSIEEISINVADALDAIIEAYQDLNQPLPDILQPVANNAPFVADTLIHLEAA
jgi:antitoxin HicB